MKEIVAFRSAEGSYFSIGKNGNEYYLRNMYTVIPNEFKMYSMDRVKELFDSLCERVPECVEVDHVKYDKPQNAFMYVVYDDMSEHLFMKLEGAGKNLCAFTFRAADYNEFYDETFMSINPRSLNIDRIRQVCRNKREDLYVLHEAIKDMDADDFQHYNIEPREDGGYNIVRNCYEVSEKDFITIMKDGKIVNTGHFRYVEFLKNQGVRVLKSEQTSSNQ